MREYVTKVDRLEDAENLRITEKKEEEYTPVVLGQSSFHPPPPHIWVLEIQCLKVHYKFGDWSEGTEDFGLVWFGLVWFGLVWFGLVWFGLVW